MKKNESFISRMDYPTAKGYYVRIYAVGARLLAKKFFGLKRYGSWETAHAEARRWRDQTIASFGPEVKLANGKNPPFQTSLSKKNTSGEIGVYYCEHRIRGVSNSCWIATWREAPGKPRVKRFYIKNHGLEEAKRLAIEYRKERVKELEALLNQNHG